MGLSKINYPYADTNNIIALEDRPKLSADELKSRFDKAGGDLFEAINLIIGEINLLINEMEEGTAASKLGASQVTPSDYTSPNIQAKLNYLRTYIDEKVIEAGSGDMTKAVYDADNDGIVDDSEKLGGLPSWFYAQSVHADQHSREGSDPVTPELIGAGRETIKITLPDPVAIIEAAADNTEYTGGTATSVTVSAYPIDDFECLISFIAGTGITVDIPASTVWAGDSPPTFTAGKYYEISIKNKRAVWGEF